MAIWAPKQNESKLPSAFYFLKEKIKKLRGDAKSFIRSKYIRIPRFNLKPSQTPQSQLLSRKWVSMQNSYHAESEAFMPFGSKGECIRELYTCIKADKTSLAIHRRAVFLAGPNMIDYHAAILKEIVAIEDIDKTLEAAFLNFSYALFFGTSAPAPGSIPKIKIYDDLAKELRRCMQISHPDKTKQKLVNASDAAKTVHRAMFEMLCVIKDITAKLRKKNSAPQKIRTPKQDLRRCAESIAYLKHKLQSGYNFLARATKALTNSIRTSFFKLCNFLSFTQ